MLILQAQLLMCPAAPGAQRPCHVCPRLCQHTGLSGGNKHFEGGNTGFLGKHTRLSEFFFVRETTDVSGNNTALSGQNADLSGQSKNLSDEPNIGQTKQWYVRPAASEQIRGRGLAVRGPSCKSPPGGVPREHTLLKGQLPRVIHHQELVYEENLRVWVDGGTVWEEEVSSN